MQPLLVVDGVKQPGSISISTVVEASNVESVTIIKGKEAIDKFGAEAVNGVVSVITKQGADQPADHLSLNKFDGLIIIDGKEYDKQSVKDVKLDASDIESMRVWKGDEAIKKFGDKGKKGVVEIITRSSPKPVAINSK